MTPQEPGTYNLTSPTFAGFHFEMEVYRSKLGHLRARVRDAKKIRGDFKGKRVETFGKEFVWSRAN